MEERGGMKIKLNQEQILKEQIMDSYRTELKEKIKFWMEYFTDDKSEIIRELGSVDITIALEIFEELDSVEYVKECENKRKKFEQKRKLARKKTAEFIYQLPAANIMYSQWWFTIDSIEKICFEIKKRAMFGRIVYLGTPTLAYYYKQIFDNEIMFVDIDSDIVASINKEQNYAQVFDLSSRKFTCSFGKADCVVMDAPWYERTMDIFLRQATNNLRANGLLFCITPPLLARPNVIEERKVFLDNLSKLDYTLIALETNYVDYSIPGFEAEVVKGLSVAPHSSWRRADMLMARLGKEVNEDIEFLSNDIIEVFHSYDKLEKKRVFLKKNKVEKNKEWFVRVDEFSREISSRKNGNEKVHLWTSEQYGYSVNNYEETKKLLKAWEKGIKFDEVLKGYSAEQKEQIEKLNKEIQLWNDEKQNHRRTTTVLLDKQNEFYSSIAVKDEAAERKTKTNGDGYRLEFQRDKDRIIWSESFRNLANKCQVVSFADREKQPLRTRLTHSIEVMELATTIGTAFGLNRDLIEAGALAHDIGHTPFGHAGEYALNKVLKYLNNKLWFSHYEHGLDVVQYIENPYYMSNGYHGLDLSKQTLDCIAKHTFDFQTFLQNFEKSKHKEFLTKDHGSLEAQAVKLSDKIAYMLTDIEDGILIGAIQLPDLQGCRLFSKPPIDFYLKKEERTIEGLHELFLSQRGAIIKVIMEDVLDASAVRLSTVDEAKYQSEYIIDFSPNMSACMDEIWKNVQSKKLHDTQKVSASNVKAAQIIEPLFYLYLFEPNLIDKQFSNQHSFLKESPYLEYYQNLGISNVIINRQKVLQYKLDLSINNNFEVSSDNYQTEIYDVVRAKDYIATFTDQKALREFGNYFGVLDI